MWFSRLRQQMERKRDLEPLQDWLYGYGRWSHVSNGTVFFRWLVVSVAVAAVIEWLRWLAI